MTDYDVHQIAVAPHIVHDRTLAADIAEVAEAPVEAIEAAIHSKGWFGATPSWSDCPIVIVHAGDALLHDAKHYLGDRSA